MKGEFKLSKKGFGSENSKLQLFTSLTNEMRTRTRYHNNVIPVPLGIEPDLKFDEVHRGTKYAVKQLLCQDLPIGPFKSILMLFRKAERIIFLGLGIEAIIVVHVDSISAHPRTLGNVVSILQCDSVL